MSELAILAEGSLSRLSQVVTRLEQKGWVSRTPDPTDGRYRLATLTEGGGDKVVAAAPGHVAEVRRLLLDPLTKAPTRQLTNIGHRIVRAIAPNDRCLLIAPDPTPLCLRDHRRRNDAAACPRAN